jgi:hypothetical protein
LLVLFTCKERWKRYLSAKTLASHGLQKMANCP